MSELKPCPFCGGTNICTEKGINLNYCDSCSAEANIEHWNTRPIEDDLRKRIVELVSSNMVMAKGVLDLKARIAELEEKQRWIPVSERLPEFNQDVTVIFYDGTISNGHFYESFDFVLEKNNGVYFDDRGRDPQIWHEAIAYWKYEDLPEVQE